jgi:hypothetical protein
MSASARRMMHERRELLPTWRARLIYSAEGISDDPFAIYCIVS